MRFQKFFSSVFIPLLLSVYTASASFTEDREAEKSSSNHPSKITVTDEEGDPHVITARQLIEIQSTLKSFEEWEEWEEKIRAQFHGDTKKFNIFMLKIFLKTLPPLSFEERQAWFDNQAKLFPVPDDLKNEDEYNHIIMDPDLDKFSWKLKSFYKLIKSTSMANTDNNHLFKMFIKASSVEQVEDLKLHLTNFLNTSQVPYKYKTFDFSKLASLETDQQSFVLEQVVRLAPLTTEAILHNFLILLCKSDLGRCESSIISCLKFLGAEKTYSEKEVYWILEAFLTCSSQKCRDNLSKKVSTLCDKGSIFDDLERIQLLQAIAAVQETHRDNFVKQLTQLGQKVNFKDISSLALAFNKVKAQEYEICSNIISEVFDNYHVITPEIITDALKLYVSIGDSEKATILFTSAKNTYQKTGIKNNQLLLFALNLFCNEKDIECASQMFLEKFEFLKREFQEQDHSRYLKAWNTPSSQFFSMINIKNLTEYLSYYIRTHGIE